MTPARGSACNILAARLAPSALAVLEIIGREAERLGMRAYLVGGPVRDVLLGLPVVDLDVVVEGSAPDLAEDLLGKLNAKAVRHEAFGTVELRFADGGHVDLATARTEIYRRPGALPEVSSADLRADLARRDFSVNALAASLSPRCFGVLLDPLGGYEDLQRRVLRALHERVFLDDPTRIVRAAAYVERLGFQLDHNTERWLRNAVEAGALGTVTGARLGAQLLRALHTPVAPSVLLRLADWGAAEGLGLPAGLQWPETLRELPRIRQSLEADEETYAQGAFVLAAGPQGPQAADLLCLGHDFAQVAQQLVNCLERDLLSALRRASSLGDTDALLASLRPGTVLALAALGDEDIRHAISEWRRAMLGFTLCVAGDDLLAAGLPPGPAVGAGLKAARRAALDGLARDAESQLRVALEAARQASSAVQDQDAGGSGRRDA